MAEEPKDLWTAVCERAGIVREADETGPPTHVPMTVLFAWHPTKDEPETASATCPLPHATKPTVFQVGKPCPLKPIFVITAIFDDGETPTIRIYALPAEKQQKPEDNIPLRWTLTRTTTTMSVAHFPDPSTFLDALAAELILAESELEEVLDPEAPPEPPAPALGAGTPGT